MKRSWVPDHLARAKKELHDAVRGSEAQHRDALWIHRCVREGHGASCVVGDRFGPQDAAGLMRANAELIRHLATIKREAGEVGDNGLVSISEIDVED